MSSAQVIPFIAVILTHRSLLSIGFRGNIFVSLEDQHVGDLMDVEAEMSL